MSRRDPGDLLRDPAEDLVERIPVVSMAKDQIAVPAHDDEALPRRKRAIHLGERTGISGPSFHHRSNHLPEGVPHRAHPAERVLTVGSTHRERSELRIGRMVHEVVLLQPLDRIAGGFQVIDESTALESSGVDEVEGDVDVEFVAVVDGMRADHLTSIETLTGYWQEATLW